MAPSGKICTRCDSTPARVYMPSGGRCLSCFESYIERTFRVALGRTGHSGAGASLAVGLSGGPCSAALAFLAARYLGSLKRPPGAVAAPLRLVHVRSPVTEGPAAAAALQAARALAGLLPGAELVEVAVPAAEATLLERARDPSDAALLRRAAVLRAAGAGAGARGGGGALLLGTSATRAAALVLGGVAVGRAPAAAPAAGAVEPLRGLAARLLVRYARLRAPGVVLVSAPPPPPASIPAVVARFVAAAHADNPAALHNVVRTADRLVPADGPPCPLCAEPRCAAAPACPQRCAPGACAAQPDALCPPCRDILRRAQRGRAEPDEALAELVRVRTAGQRRAAGRALQRNAIAEFLLEDEDADVDDAV